MEDYKQLKNELQNIILSDELDGEANLIKTTQTFLRRFSETGSGFKNKKPERTEEERALIDFAEQNNYNEGIHTDHV